MSKLVWEKGCTAAILAIEAGEEETLMDMLRDMPYNEQTFDLLRIRQGDDEIRFTKSELKFLVSYLNCVIPTMKDF